MKLFIFGSSGMLGNYLSSYFMGKYDIVCLTRNEVDISQVASYDLRNFFSKVGFKNGDIIINAAGTIKPRVDELGDLNAILVNSVFPHFLSNTAQDLGLKLIHITTDCVFTGDRGSYSESDKHDVSDVYGRTKSLGEPQNCTVIRTSIIGEEISSKRSLVEWIKSSRGRTIYGYTNHFWNGLTCLQVSKLIHHLIENNSFWLGVRHIHSPETLSKFELLELIAKIYELEIKVEPKETDQKCDRSLTTIHEQFEIPSLKTQISEMHKFKLV